jgi:hypothetical protein
MYSSYNNVYSDNQEILNKQNYVENIKSKFTGILPPPVSPTVVNSATVR